MDVVRDDGVFAVESDWNNLISVGVDPVAGRTDFFIEGGLAALRQEGFFGTVYSILKTK